MPKKFTLLSLVPVLVSLLLTIGVLTVFSACGRKEDGTWMHCHSAQNAVAVCGLVLIVLFVLGACIGMKAIRIAVNTAAFAVALVTCRLPGTIVPMCMMQTMRCYTVMQPFVRIMAVLLMVCAAVNVIRIAGDR